MRKTLGPSLALVCLLLSCKNPFSPIDPSKITVRINVTFGDGEAKSSKTVVPDFTGAADSFEVVLNSNNGYAAKSGTVTSPATSITFADVEVGSWDISVTAKKAGATIGTGILKNRQIADQSTFTVPITRLQEGGIGSMELTLSFPSSTGIDYVQGEIAGATLAPALVDSGSDKIATFFKDNLESGIYALVLTFRRGGPSGTVAGVFRESVNIWNNMVSDKWVDSEGNLVSRRTFSASEFFDANASLFNLQLSAGIVSFSSFATSYDAGDVTQTSVTVTATASISGQYLEYRWNGGSWNEISSGLASADLVLAAGINSVEVRVTAPDRQTQKTYQVMISSPTHLDLDAWITGSIFSGRVKWYYVDVMEGQKYRVCWKDFWYSSSYSCDIVVSAFRADLTTSYFSSVDTGPANIITAPATERIYIKIQGYLYMSSGTFAVMVKHNFHTVSYNGNGSTGGSVPASNTYDSGQTVTVATGTGVLTKTGSLFSGWNTQADGSGTSYAEGQTFTMGSDDVTLYARWTTATPLSLNTWISGSLGPGDVKWYSFGASATNGYGIGWDDSAEGSGPYTCNVKVSVFRSSLSSSYFTDADSGFITPYLISALATETTYIKVQGYSADGSGTFAVRVGRSYTVSYNGNGGTGAPSPGTYAVGQLVTVASGTIPYFSKSGYVFSGWNTLANGSGTSYAEGQTFTMGSANVTLYAQWSTAITGLTAGSWATDAISAGAIKWYSFNATSGQVYNIRWDDSVQGSGPYTCDIKVSAYQKDMMSTYFSSIDSGYTTPKSLVTSSNYQICIKVQGCSPDSSGTFAVRFAGAYKMLYNGNGNTGGTVPVDATGHEQGETVTVLHNTGSLTRSGFGFAGWNTQPDGSGISYDPGVTLTMGFANFTLYARWAVPTLLSEDTWIPDAISPGEAKWYRFNASAGRAYDIFWDDASSGTGLSTCDITVTAYRTGMSTTYFTGVDSGYATPRTVCPETDGMIFMEVRGRLDESFGTFALKVAENSSDVDVNVGSE